MNKLEITICTGTTCYVMGGGNLMQLGESLDEEISQKVHIKGSPCLGQCKDGRHGKAPYVMVGDTVISEATTEAVLQVLKKHFHQY
jgi:NADH:ubiquinone oxidoreductase subunit E